jgi:hypothetical protein
MELAMEKPAWDDLIERITVLEREKRRLSWMGAAAFLGLVVLISEGPNLFRAKVLKAERFVLCDQAGKVRAQMAMRPEDDAVEFALFGPEQRHQLLLQALHDGSSTLTIWDKDRMRIAMSAMSSGPAAFHVINEGPGSLPSE